MEAWESVDDSGLRMEYERYSGILAVSAFEYGDRFKMLCDGCPKRGENLSCPPYSPSFLTHIKGATEARVFCIRLPQKKSFNLDLEWNSPGQNAEFVCAVGAAFFS